VAEAARYLFDRTFDAPVKGTESEEAVAHRQLQDEWERKMAEACCTAYEEGRAEGEEAARKSLEADMRLQVENLLASAQKIAAGLESECDRIRGDAIELGSLSANVLAEELIARSPELNLESLFTEALEHMDDAPHIALTVNDMLVDGVQKLVTSVATERGFTGNIVVLGDPETKQGNCVVQWADGGIALDIDKKRSAITQIVRRHLDRLGAPAGSIPQQGQAAHLQTPALSENSIPAHPPAGLTQTDFNATSATDPGETT